MRHIIAILLQNEAGALTRVAGLFSTRGYNIESLTVAATDDPTVSRITLVTRGSDAVLQQIANQLLKLIDVVGVEDTMYLDIQDRDDCLRVRRLVHECLTEREKEVIISRYGLGGRMPRTQREIAKKLGISRSYVSRIEKRALEKLEEAIGERG